MRTLGLAVLLAWSLIGCIPAMPAYDVDVSDGAWNVTSVADEDMSALRAIVTFRSPDPDSVRLDTACGATDMGFVLDSDSDWIEFESVDGSAECAEPAAEQERALLAALSEVDRWSVQATDMITLHGPGDIVMTRATE